MTSSACSAFSGEDCGPALGGGTAIDEADAADLPTARLVDARLACVADAISSSCSLDTVSTSPFTVDGAFSISYGSRLFVSRKARREERFAELDCRIDDDAGGCAVGGPGPGPDGPSEFRRRLLADVLGSVRLTDEDGGTGALGVGSGDGSAGGSEDSSVVVADSGSGSGAGMAKAKRSPKSASWTWWRLGQGQDELGAAVMQKGGKGAARQTYAAPRMRCRMRSSRAGYWLSEGIGAGERGAITHIPPYCASFRGSLGCAQGLSSRNVHHGSSESYFGRLYSHLQSGRETRRRDEGSAGIPISSISQKKASLLQRFGSNIAICKLT